MASVGKVRQPSFRDRSASASSAECGEEYPHKSCSCADLRTIQGDNQPNTYPKARLLLNRHFAVISIWDERDQVSKRSFVTKSVIGDGFVETVLGEQVFARSQSVVARVVAGETLIVPVRAKVGDLASIYTFNGTGSLIWKLLEHPRTAAELAMAVAEEYEVETAQAEGDVTEFVSEMKAVGLVETAASAAAAGA
jgi:hypothetical protein